MIVMRRIEVCESDWKFLIKFLTEKRDALKDAGKNTPGNDLEWIKIYDLLHNINKAEKFFG